MQNKQNLLRIVELVAPNSDWAIQFETEALKLRDILKGNCQAIHHIGSTAIPHIYAKPVIDMLVVVNDLSSIDAFNPLFERLGYECKGEFGVAGRRFYWKDKIKRTHHVHLFEKGNPEIKRHLVFRDYMRQHTNEAHAYSWTKRCLAEQFSMDRDAYVNGKDSFIRAMHYRAGVAKSDQLQAKDQTLLEPYNPTWKKLAIAEINAIKRYTHLPYLTIEHLGSTAVEGLSAKPTIDIFIALENMSEVSQWIEPLKALGYVDWPDNPDKTHTRFFKGMPPFGVQRTHHVHIMKMGDEFKRRVAFRDLLRQNADLCKQYEKLKQKLAKKYLDDREAYTEAKAQFVQAALSHSTDIIRPINDVQAEPLKVQYTSCIIVTHDNKILLQQRGEDFYTFSGFVSAFGGKVKSDETPVQAIIRELHEELGAKVKTSDIVSLGAYTEAVTNHTELVHGYFWHDKDHTITGCYEGKARYFSVVSEVLKLPKIMDDVKWLLHECNKRQLIRGVNQ